MAELTIHIPVSTDQEDVIVDHVFSGAELGMVPDEKVWMLKQARSRHPDCKILAADLDIRELVWTLRIETK